MKQHRDNPAKAFLRRYTGLCGRVDALDRAIRQAMERATNTALTLKEIKVLSTPAEHDPMAEDVVSAVDACEILYRFKAEAEAALREILCAIDSLTDERQKELLTLRYINGESFDKINELMHYEKTQVFVIHGRALIEINKWLEGRANNGQTKVIDD
jgi:DNA-directed RNA polymerase specialized sigma24 family protein